MTGPVTNKETHDPTLHAPVTDTLLPMRANDEIDRELPTAVAPAIDNWALPSLAVPEVLTSLPILLKEPIDKVLPNHAESNVDRVDPSRAKLAMDTELLHDPGPNTLTEETDPKAANPSTVSELPSLTKDRVDNALLATDVPMTDTLVTDPNATNPIAERELPILK